MSFVRPQPLARMLQTSGFERSLLSRATATEHDEIDIRVVDKSIVQTPIRGITRPTRRRLSSGSRTAGRSSGAISRMLSIRAT